MVRKMTDKVIPQRALADSEALPAIEADSAQRYPGGTAARIVRVGIGSMHLTGVARIADRKYLFQAGVVHLAAGDQHFITVQHGELADDAILAGQVEQGVTPAGDMQ
jgi:hypothetical protein